MHGITMKICLIVTYLFSADEFDKHGWLHNKTDKPKVSDGLLSIYYQVG